MIIDLQKQEKNKKVLGKFKDELGGKIIVEFCALRAKTYAYKLDDDTKNKKAKGTKKCIVKREIIFQNYVDSLFKNEVLLDHNNDLGVIIITFTQKKLIKQL